MKKKYFISKKNQKDWSSFTKQLKNTPDKKSLFKHDIIKTNKVRRLDLHGLSLVDANQKVKNFILTSFEAGCVKLVIITGKGSRSKVYEDPYRSQNMNILKNSVPEYINGNEELMNKINKISKASKRDGEEGAFYIYLKKNSKL